VSRVATLQIPCNERCSTHKQEFQLNNRLLKISQVILLSYLCSGCVVGTAVSVTKDIVVGTVDVATDVVGTAVDVVKPGKKKK